MHVLTTKTILYNGEIQFNDDLEEINVQAPISDTPVK